MNIIFFDDNYPKLHNQTTAKLVAIETIRINNEKHKELLEYDTIKSDGSYYPIDTNNNNQYIQLVFIGNKHIPFCTLRKFGGYNWSYYKTKINDLFKIVIKKDPKI